MIAFRVLLNLMLAVALAVICPIRCHVADGLSADQAEASPSGCSCCDHRSSDGPVAPVGDDCCGGDCVCDGAIDSPRVAAIDVPSLAPSETASFDARDAIELSDSTVATRSVPPGSPGGTRLRALLASWLI